MSEGAALIKGHPEARRSRDLETPINFGFADGDVVGRRYKNNFRDFHWFEICAISLAMTKNQNFDCLGRAAASAVFQDILGDAELLVV